MRDFFDQLKAGCGPVVLLIVVASGNDPLWSGPALVISIRTAIICWALLSFLFEILYGRTYLVVTPTLPPDEDVNTHGD